ARHGRDPCEVRARALRRTGRVRVGCRRPVGPAHRRGRPSGPRPRRRGRRVRTQPHRAHGRGARRATPMSRFRTVPDFDDRGQLAGMASRVFGFLVLVVGSLVLANAWAVVDAKYAATAAAREAVRAYVEASSETQADRAALDAATSSIRSHG